MKRKTEHWAYDELRKRLEEKTQSWVPHLQDVSEPRILRVTRTPDHELSAIFLMDPQARQELDEVLLQRIYRHILETMGLVGAQQVFAVVENEDAGDHDLDAWIVLPVKK